MNNSGALNNYSDHPSDLFRYNKAGLIIADFSKPTPQIFETTSELISLGLLPKSYPYKLEDMSPYTYVSSLLDEYRQIFPTI